MKTVYCTDDGKEVFASKKDCLAYEKKVKQTVRVPLFVLKEAIRQCTPYMIPKRERDWLKELLERSLPSNPA